MNAPEVPGEWTSRWLAVASGRSATWPAGVKVGHVTVRILSAAAGSASLRSELQAGLWDSKHWLEPSA